MDVVDLPYDQGSSDLPRLVPAVPGMQQCLKKSVSNDRADNNKSKRDALAGT